MRIVRAWFSKLAGIFQGDGAEQSFAEEIESHLALHIADNLRRGMTPEEARRVALLKLGGQDATKEAWRDQRRLPVWGPIRQDARFALRTMRRSPGLTAVAVLTLALGIGANTAMFSIVNGVLLQPLPYRDPARLMDVFSSSPSRGFPDRRHLAARLPRDARAQPHPRLALRILRRRYLQSQRRLSGVSGSRHRYAGIHGVFRYPRGSRAAWTNLPRE